MKISDISDETFKGFAYWCEGSKPETEDFSRHYWAVHIMTGRKNGIEMFYNKYEFTNGKDNSIKVMRGGPGSLQIDVDISDYFNLYMDTISKSTPDKEEMTD